MPISFDIPLPPRAVASKRRGITDMLRKLKVGDSVPYEELVKEPYNPSRPYTGIYSIATQIEIKLAVRKTEGGGRIWRIS